MQGTWLKRAAAGMLTSVALVAGAAAPMRPSTDGSASDIQARYEHERARCLSGQSGQDQPTCLKEAAAAREEARRGQLRLGNQDYHRNQLQRCKAFTGDDAEQCRLRVEGAGTTSGSVASGGILRELVTIVPAPAPAQPPSPPSQ